MTNNSKIKEEEKRTGPDPVSAWHPSVDLNAAVARAEGACRANTRRLDGVDQVLSVTTAFTAPVIVTRALTGYR